MEESLVPAEIRPYVDSSKLFPYDVYEGLAIKPDGTPYRLTILHGWMGDDWSVCAGGVMQTMWERGGGEVTRLDCEWDVDKQVSQIEDVVSLKTADLIIIQSANETMVVPAVEESVDAGIPVFAWCNQLYSDKITSISHHDYPGPTGIQVIGRHFAELADAMAPEQLHIYEVWGLRSMDTAHERHDGFHAGLDIANHPNIKVTESPDSSWSNEITAQLVMDAFTADPTLNALYSQGGGQTGAIEAITAIGRNVPLGDPGHVVICPQDVDTRMIEALQGAEIDACGSSGPWQMTDTLMKVVYWSIAGGESVMKDIKIPVFVLTQDNLETQRLFGGTVAFPFMPLGNFDIWPVLDSRDFGIETPTIKYAN
jgi:ABC-type sugar transport system substrate-binding protein